MNQPTITGRSSSHFTRVTRIFAAELHVDYSFNIVRDLMSLNTADYADNPALNIPTLRATTGTWYGALNISRELSRQSRLPLRIVWPEHLGQPMLANAQELITQAMSTEVTLIMANAAGSDTSDTHQLKIRQRLTNIMSWLDNNVNTVISVLPERDLSYLEVTLFCLMQHLEFRKVLPTDCYRNTLIFCEHFGGRSSAVATKYRFDT
jgi:hypothetical protein